MKSQSTSVTRLALGTLLVLAGLLSAVVTVLARRENEKIGKVDGLGDFRAREPGKEVREVAVVV